MLNVAGAACLLGLALVAVLAPAPAHAQATRTWVSGVGDDANPCSRTAPCKTFAGAISKTAAGGYINCIDSGGFGALTITKSITIDCSHVLAGVLAVGTNGININAAATDNVALRGISIEGGAGQGLIGINYINAGTVHIERVRISGFRTGVNAAGIRFAPPNGAGAELNVSDTTIVDCGNAATNGGIVIVGTGTATARAAINRVQLFNNATGVRIDGSTGTAGGAINLVMRDSAATGNNNAGIHAVAAAGAQNTIFDNVTSVGNSTGITADGANTRVFVSRVDLFANNIGINRVNNGQVISYLDNHINNNFSSNGTPSSTQPSQ